jgi:hypothetical protein
MPLAITGHWPALTIWLHARRGIALMLQVGKQVRASPEPGHKRLPTPGKRRPVRKGLMIGKQQPYLASQVFHSIQLIGGAAKRSMSCL